MHLGLGPVIHVWHEGLVLVAPHLGADVAVLVLGLRVVEGHVVGIEELHYLGENQRGSGPLPGHTVPTAHKTRTGTPVSLQSPNGLART